MLGFFLLLEINSNGRGVNGIECGSLGQSNGGVEAAAAQGVGAEGLAGGEWEKMMMEVARVRREKMTSSDCPEMW